MHWQSTCLPTPALTAFGPPDRLPGKHIPVAVAAPAANMNLALNQPPARQRCRGNLKWNGVRGKLQKSTGRVFISSGACGKISELRKIYVVYDSHMQTLFFISWKQDNALRTTGDSCILASPNKGAYSRFTHRTNKLHVILCCTVQQL